MCFGDSITGPRPREPYQHQYLKFSDLLGLMLEARRGLGTVTTLNRGWAGQTAVEAEERVQEDVLSESPGIAVVLLGGNDAGALGPCHPKTRESLVKIFSALRDARIKTLALQYHLLVNPASPGVAWRHLVENNALIGEAAGCFGIPVLNMEIAMEKAAGDIPLAALVSLEDGVHLSPGGEIVYARAIFDRLNDLGWID
ncbi:MAG: SGNH/GDSL hydrolase family protein [Janthinobacterium lividum]